MLLELNRDRSLGAVYGPQIFTVHIIHEMITAILALLLAGRNAPPPPPDKGQDE